MIGNTISPAKRIVPNNNFFIFLSSFCFLYMQYAIFPGVCKLYIFPCMLIPANIVGDDAKGVAGKLL
jgi:hypothetical protein